MEVVLVEGGSIDTARRTIHMRHYVLGIHDCPAPPQTTCSGGRPIAPTAMWERASGRFESPAATVHGFDNYHNKDSYIISFLTRSQINNIIIKQTLTVKRAAESNY